MSCVGWPGEVLHGVQSVGRRHVRVPERHGDGPVPHQTGRRRRKRGARLCDRSNPADRRDHPHLQDADAVCELALNRSASTMVTRETCRRARSYSVIAGHRTRRALLRRGVQARYPRMLHYCAARFTTTASATPTKNAGVMVTSFRLIARSIGAHTGRADESGDHRRSCRHPRTPVPGS
jgi:hypothetical protein